MELWKFRSENLVHKRVDFDVWNALKLTNEHLYFQTFFRRGDIFGSLLNKKGNEKELKRGKKGKAG